MSEKLISLNELKMEDLPLKIEENATYIKEHDLEKFLIVNRYNVYRRTGDFTYQDVIDNGWVLDSTLIHDAMFDLGFDAIDDENGALMFFILH